MAQLLKTHIKILDLQLKPKYRFRSTLNKNPGSVTAMDNVIHKSEAKKIRSHTCKSYRWGIFIMVNCCDELFIIVKSRPNNFKSLLLPIFSSSRENHGVVWGSTHLIPPSKLRYRHPAIMLEFRMHK